MVERLRKRSRLFGTVSDFVLQPTQEGELRRRVLFWIPTPLPVLGLVYLLVGGTLSAPGWTILLAASVGVGTLLLAMVVQPTPLPEGLAPPVSARRSLHRFRQFTGLKICLALVPVLLGAAAAITGGGMYPLFAALVLAWPQLLLAMPTFFTITRARRAMEAWGTTAYLWHALSRSAKVTWPIATPLARSWRVWRAERAEYARRQKEREREREQAWKRAVREESARSAEDWTSSLGSSNERTTPINPLPGRPAGDDEATDVLPHLRGGRDDEATDVLPHLRTGEETKPTDVLPHLDGDGGRTSSGTPSGPRGTVQRAALQLLERGSALGLAVRRDRRGAQSTRRPHSPKP